MWYKQYKMGFVISQQQKKLNTLHSIARNSITGSVLAVSKTGKVVADWKA